MPRLIWPQISLSYMMLVAFMATTSMKSDIGGLFDIGSGDRTCGSILSIILSVSLSRIATIAMHFIHCKFFPPYTVSLPGRRFSLSFDTRLYRLPIDPGNSPYVIQHNLSKNPSSGRCNNPLSSIFVAMVLTNSSRLIEEIRHLVDKFPGGYEEWAETHSEGLTSSSETCLGTVKLQGPALVDTAAQL